MFHILGPEYRKVLNIHGVAHVYNHWSYLPLLAEQHPHGAFHRTLHGAENAHATEDFL